MPSFCECLQLRDTHFKFQTNSLYQKSSGLHTHIISSMRFLVEKPRVGWHAQRMYLDVVGKEMQVSQQCRVIWIGRRRERTVSKAISAPSASLLQLLSWDLGEGRGMLVHGRKRRAQPPALQPRADGWQGRFTNRNCTNGSLRLQQDSQWNVQGHGYPHFDQSVQTMTQNSRINFRGEDVFLLQNLDALDTPSWSSEQLTQLLDVSGDKKEFLSA